jgi:SAM-dependent methyltransferase
VKLRKKAAKKAFMVAYRSFVGLFGSFADRLFLDPNVPMARMASHANFLQYLTKIGNHKGVRILEVGSREVTGKSKAREQFSNAEYVGFDFYPGPNVDVVGDAHQLSKYFGDQKFDIVYSSAVFEHLAMPWLVATEIAKLLKVGGTVLIDTRFCYRTHERPWHFFQCSDMALKVLFSPALGIECIEAGASNPMVGRYSAFADPNLRFKPITALYAHSSFLGRKTRDVDHFDWATIDLDEVVYGSRYPLPLS